MHSKFIINRKNQKMEAFVQGMESFEHGMDQLRGKPISDLTTNEYNILLVGIVHGIIQQEDLTEVEACIGTMGDEGHLIY